MALIVEFICLSCTIISDIIYSSFVDITEVKLIRAYLAAFFGASPSLGVLTFHGARSLCWIVRDLRRLNK